MIDTKELRQLAQAAMTGPDGVSLNWVKLLQDFQKQANPAVINELLDRLLFAQVTIEELRKDNEALRMAVSGMADKEIVAYMSSRNGFISKENKNPEYNIPLVKKW